VLRFEPQCAWRAETKHFRHFSYDELFKRDKLDLDLFWLKDASTTDPDTLPTPAENAGRNRRMPYGSAGEVQAGRGEAELMFEFSLARTETDFPAKCVSFSTLFSRII
jgi:hypothetical protein